MFIGEFSHSIDPKGRLAIPFRFRKILKDGGVVARSVNETCLAIYPSEEWEKLAAKLTSLPLSDPKARAFSRLMFSGAVEVHFDRQGRILLPGFLREFAKLKNQVMLCGVYNWIEIWDEKLWQSYKSKTEKESVTIEKHLSNLGI